MPQIEVGDFRKHEALFRDLAKESYAASKMLNLLNSNHQQFEFNLNLWSEDLLFQTHFLLLESGKVCRVIPLRQLN